MPAQRSPLTWFAHGGWYLVLDVVSFGLLSFVPPLHAALRTRRPTMWLWSVLYLAAVVGVLGGIPGDTLRGGLVCLLVLVSVVHAVVLRRQVWADAPDPAVAAVLAARARRAEARGVASSDPRMARELRIGRPDLPRRYDDGGLVDLNSAPAPVIADVCGIDLEPAHRIVAARQAGVPFATVEDVFSAVDLPYPLWDRIRDRAVVVT